MVGLHIKEILDYHLVTISGAVLTPGSLGVGLGILFFSLVAAGLAGRGTRKLLEKRGLPAGAQFAAAKIVRYTLITLGSIIAVNSVGFKLDALIATSAVLAVGIGFGLQNIAQNFISGVILLIEQPVSKGDVVKVGDTLGVIDDIGLRATHIITRDEVTIIVPNSGLISQPVINHSRPTNRLRMQIKVGVAYGSDTKRVSEVLMQLAVNEPQVLPEPAPEVRFEEFGESSLEFALLVWIMDPREDRRIASALRFAIDAAFRAHGIEIPFPQRDLHVRSVPDRLLGPGRS